MKKLPLTTIVKMKSISNEQNCYFTPSMTADLIFVLINIFNVTTKADKFSWIYQPDYIDRVKNNYRFLGEVLASLPNSGGELLEFLLLNRSFNDIKEFNNFVASLEDEEFFYHLYEQQVDIELIRNALQGDESLNRLYSKFGEISTSYLALRGLFSNKALFLRELSQCMDVLCNQNFIEEYENIMSGVYEELPSLEKALVSSTPLDLSQVIMGKTFKNKGPYENFIFVPSYFMDKKAIRYYQKDQILFYDPSFKDFNKNDMIKMMKIISDSTRFEIIELLCKNETMMGKDLASELKLTTATISHHIEQLREVGFINEERVKNSKYYSINNNSVNRFVDFLTSKLKSK